MSEMMLENSTRVSCARAASDLACIGTHEIQEVLAELGYPAGNHDVARVERAHERGDREAQPVATPGAPDLSLLLGGTEYPVPNRAHQPAVETIPQRDARTVGSGHLLATGPGASGSALGGEQVGPDLGIAVSANRLNCQWRLHVQDPVQETLHLTECLAQLAVTLPGETVIAAALASDGFANALDPARLLHFVQERVKRARTDLVAHPRQLVAQLHTRDRTRIGSVEDPQSHQALDHVAAYVDHRSSISYNDIKACAMDVFPSPPIFPYLPTLTRMALALALGLFVGLERERRGKEAGLRTFGFAALLGGLGGLLGDAYALLGLGLLSILIVFLNWATLRAGEGLELTTSAALLVTGFVGVLAGQGHTFTPVTAGVATAALLAWKERLAGFSLGLTETEIRSAILLAIFAFIVFPVLPSSPIDPWGLISPQAAWLTVIMIAALGFANYILLKVYGARGVELTGFLGGLVNSTVTVTELSARSRESEGRLADVAYRGVLLSTAAMAVRNAVLLAILAAGVLVTSLLPLALMLASSMLLAWRAPRKEPSQQPPVVRLASPFSLQAALKFGLIFLVLQATGTLGQDVFGNTGFYAISLIAGLVSSASGVAAAAALAAHGTIPVEVAGVGVVLNSLASTAVKLPLVARISGDRRLALRTSTALMIVILLGVGAMLVPSESLVSLASAR